MSTEKKRCTIIAAILTLFAVASLSYLFSRFFVPLSEAIGPFISTQRLIVFGCISAMYVIAFFTGAILASGIGCYLDRKKRGESWVGRSHCESCGHTLSVTDLIPVFGYLVNNGKCKYCGETIPFKHLVSEYSFGCIGMLAFTVVLIFIC